MTDSNEWLGLHSGDLHSLAQVTENHQDDVRATAIDPGLAEDVAQVSSRPSPTAIVEKPHRELGRARASLRPPPDRATHELTRNVLGIDRMRVDVGALLLEQTNGDDRGPTMTTRRSATWNAALVLAALIMPGCGGSDPSTVDAATGDVTCTDSAVCPDGTLCANQLCKPICPGPGGLGQTCGEVGSFCCGLGETCETAEELVCTNACTPFDEGCPAGFGCHITNGLFDYSDCRAAGTGDQGASCVTSADCAPGGFCIGGTTPMCVRYCGIGDAAHGCDAGTQCQSWAFLGGVAYGACLPVTTHVD